jgi:hypothetical protein
MTRLLRRGAVSTMVSRHTVGNALVLHLTERISDEAQVLAMAVAEDAEHDIVVLDLPGDLPIGVWEAVAAALPRQRRPVRLVVCGKEQDTTSLAGQWLAERLGRQVVAPHGRLALGAAGAMFVHSGTESGWVRYYPNRPPVWEAKRFPQPPWDTALAEKWPTSSTGVADPLPGGVWIHDSRDHPAVPERRRWLVGTLPCLHETFTIVLGCPGTPPLSLDDIARFWRNLDDEARSQARFVQYGPLELKGEPIGQTLADLLKAPIVCYSGIPMGSPADPEMRTVDGDGELGWQAFARELRYLPRADPKDAPTTPVVISHRAPLNLGDQLTPMVYWYAHDAVVEVVQAGLWMRPPETPKSADAVRARRADPGSNTLIFDDGTEQRAVRMRALAEDIVARLDPATRERSQLLPASTLVAAVLRMPSLAGGRLNGEAGASPFAPSPSQMPAAGPVPEAALPPSLAEAPVAEISAVEAPVAEISAVEAPVARIPAVEAPGVQAALPAPEPVRPAPEPERPAPEPEPAPELPEGTVLRPNLFAAFVTPPAPVAAPPPTIHAPASVPAAAAPVAPAVPAPVAPSAPEASADLILAVPDPIAVPEPVAKTPPPREPEPATPRPATTTTATSSAAPPPSAPAVRLQPVPEPAASALLSSRGLDDERAWLRKTLAGEFDAVASSITRVLSEHPGLQGGDPRASDEILTDSLAVRLYLSTPGAAIDAGLRTAAVGPHVPFARCVVSGLTRLPSHRGATVFSASPTAEEWELLAARKLVTEWGFTSALTAPSRDQAGAVDVLIWSMTARRTRLLEPEGDDGAENRVLFVPGTSFKVLDMARSEGSRGQILLRELASDEIDPSGKVDGNRAAFDDLAVASLRRCAERWAENTTPGRLGPGAAARLGALPGLISNVGQIR